MSFAYVAVSTEENGVKAFKIYRSAEEAVFPSEVDFQVVGFLSEDDLRRGKDDVVCVVEKEADFRRKYCQAGSFFEIEGKALPVARPAEVATCAAASSDDPSCSLPPVMTTAYFFPNPPIVAPTVVQSQLSSSGPYTPFPLNLSGVSAAPAAGVLGRSNLSTHSAGSDSSLPVAESFSTPDVPPLEQAPLVSKIDELDRAIRSMLYSRDWAACSSSPLEGDKINRKIELLQLERAVCVKLLARIQARSALPAAPSFVAPTDAPMVAQVALRFSGVFQSPATLAAEAARRDDQQVQRSSLGASISSDGSTESDRSQLSASV